MAKRVIVKGNIGNAIHSVAPDHISTTADEIFDEDLQQYQSEINQAKADKAPNAVAGHVAVFDNNGNPVDGGILTEGVYDVSEKNPTGGPNSDGKFTLEYILSNANTLIPSSVRKGGMRIKFVQSSDNKYVQYFCKSRTFTTDISAWEKMNLKDEVNELMDDVYGDVNTAEWTNHLVSSSLEITSNANYLCSPATYLKAGARIAVLSGGANIAYICSCQENGTLIAALVTTRGNDSSLVQEYNYTILSDGYYRVCYRYTDGDIHIWGDSRIALLETNLETAVLSLKENVANVEDEFYKGVIGKVDDSAWTNQYITLSLNTDTNANYKCSPALYLKTGTKIVIYSGGAGISYVSACDSSGTPQQALVTTIGNDSSVINRYSYTIPSDGYYRFCYRYTDGNIYIFNADQFTLNDAQANISELNTVIGVEEISTTWTLGQYIEATRLTIENNAKYKLSDPFTVVAGQKIVVNSAGGGIAYICTSDSEGNIISVGASSPSGASTTENSRYEYLVLEDGFVRVCYKYTIDGSFVKCIQKESLKDPNHLRILLLGNSYGSDAWGYVPFILKNYGITCDIYMYWRGALSLDDLVTFWESDDDYDATSPQAAQGAYRYLYHINTRYQTAWETLERQSAKNLVAMGGWDIITMLQWSVYTIDNSHTNPYFEQVVELIRQSLPTPYTLGWQMSWTRPVYDGVDVDKKQDNIDVAELINKQHPANIIFPCASAIFNCRANQTLAAIGDSTYHNLWASDNVHLEEGLPCYIAGLAVVQSLFNKFFPNKCVLGDITRPTNSNITAWNNPQRQMPTGGTITSVTEGNCLLAQKAAVIANKYPYEINGV